MNLILYSVKPITRDSILNFSFNKFNVLAYGLCSKMYFVYGYLDVDFYMYKLNVDSTTILTQFGRNFGAHINNDDIHILLVGPNFHSITESIRNLIRKNIIYMKNENLEIHVV